MEIKIKKPLYKKWWFWTIIVLALLIVIGLMAGSYNNIFNKNSTKPAAADNTKTNTNTNTENKELYSVNEVAKTDKAEMSVTKVETSKGIGFDTPKGDMEFVIVTVKIKNISKEKIDYYPFDFKLQNSKGEITGEALSTVNQDTALQSGKLAPGEEIEGTIVFEEPKGDKGLILQYLNNIFSDDVKLQFKLN